ncbi:hypothetical protein IWQ60_002387 [Tieghemiomyces parasiticus]|uniref:Uncharacterized protein n=1 Tax=Tieghemiomyces parasiticus TaxID=78921 RepID=A0A9W8ACT7_9FUNG|nr:hypothetical protein IWQ60_002387 [Tieghemiomyces parasiticus]
MAPSKLPVVIVTGASRGLGLAIVREVLSLGAHVLGTARSEESLVRLQREWQESRPATDADQPEFTFIAGDITKSATGDLLVAAALKQFGRIDAVIHNAGIIEPVAKLADADLDAWRTLFDVNLFSIIGLTQKALPHLRERRGRVVMVGSGAAVKAITGWSAYCCSKAALYRLTDCLAAEEPDVTTLAVAPGVVDTDMQIFIRERANAAMKPSEHERFTNMKQSGQLVQPDQPGHVIAQLALHADHELSGQCLYWTDACFRTFRKPRNSRPPSPRA